MGLDNMRSGTMNAMNAANLQTKDDRIKGVNMMKSVGRRVMGVSRERTLVKCQSYGRLSHTTENFYISRSCPKCGRYGHSPSNFWGEIQVLSLIEWE